MTCRHAHGDPACSATVGGWRAAEIEAENERYRQSQHEKEIKALEKKIAEKESKTPDSKNYEIVDIFSVGQYLVLKALYPNCNKCSFEGTKVMVFKASLLDAVKWKEIDPHFTEFGLVRPATKAPGPVARFPGSDEGWKDAIAYAKVKGNERG